jgi:DNA-binding transcriptional ArsR family regulator
MIRYELAGMDLADVRFAISPLNELVFSLRAWRDPGRYPLHLPWLHRVEAARGDLDGDLLLALTNERLWTPDFLTPRPRSPLTRIEDELRALADADPAVVLHDLRALHDPLPPPLRGRPTAIRRRIVGALAAYWERSFSDAWPKMRAVLEADVVHRGRELAQWGMAHMFANLAETVGFADGVVSVRLRSPISYTRSTDGAGLTLMPTLFGRTASAPISPEEPPLIMYAARGVGTLWEAQRLPSSAALAGLVGATRAGLLAHLATPASSTELAVRLGVTTTAVNQHLRALRAAGLLTSARHGRSVLYRLSDLGDRLVDRAGAGAPQT